MRHALLIVVVFLVCCAPVNATYDYVITSGYSSLPTLYQDESILMTGGGGYSLNLRSNSIATIEGTSALSQGSGGVWEVQLMDSSNLQVTGGQVHEINIGNDASATLSGGLIERIWSGQYAWQWDYGVDPPELVPNPHITFVCDVDSVVHDIQTNVLTGNWLDGSSFEVQLIDVAGNSSAIDNIHIIPEPASLLLLGLGGLILRRKV